MNARMCVREWGSEWMTNRAMVRGDACSSSILIICNDSIICRLMSIAITWYDMCYEWQGAGTPGAGLLRSTVLSQAAKQLLHSMLLPKYKRQEVGIDVSNYNSTTNIMYDYCSMHVCVTSVILDTVYSLQCFYQLKSNFEIKLWSVMHFNEEKGVAFSLQFV